MQPRPFNTEIIDRLKSPSLFRVLWLINKILVKSKLYIFPIISKETKCLEMIAYNNLNVLPFLFLFVWASVFDSQYHCAAMELYVDRSSGLELSMHTRLGSNSRSTCLCLPRAGTKGVHHHVWLTSHFDGKCAFSLHPPGRAHTGNNAEDRLSEASCVALRDESHSHLVIWPSFLGYYFNTDIQYRRHMETGAC